MTNNSYHLDFNVTGADRKRLVQALAEYAGADSKYLGAPSFAYEVDTFTVDRNGVVSFAERIASEEIEGLLATLADAGFVSQVSNLGCEDEESDDEPLTSATAAENGATDEEPSNDPTATENAAQGESCGLTVKMPLDKVAVGTLTKLLEVKGCLIRKALGISALPIEIGEKWVSFPWFSDALDSDEVKAYTHLIAALCEMTRNQKRITATEKEVDNEKYAFRCFLLRLGFIGSEYKTERKILLRNLTGSSAFKAPKEKELQPEPPQTENCIYVDGDPEVAEAVMDAILIHQVNESLGGAD